MRRSGRNGQPFGGIVPAPSSRACGHPSHARGHRTRAGRVGAAPVHGRCGEPTTRVPGSPGGRHAGDAPGHPPWPPVPASHAGPCRRSLSTSRLPSPPRAGRSAPIIRAASTTISIAMLSPTVPVSPERTPRSCSRSFKTGAPSVVCSGHGSWRPGAVHDRCSRRCPNRAGTLYPAHVTTPVFPVANFPLHRYCGLCLHKLPGLFETRSVLARRTDTPVATPSRSREPYRTSMT